MVFILFTSDFSFLNTDYTGIHILNFSEPLFCGSPDKLMNTTITGTEYKVDSSIEYQCPEGHRLIGDKTRKCSSNGFWTGSPPTCKCK